MIEFIQQFTPTNWFFLLTMISGFVYTVKANGWKVDQLSNSVEAFKTELKSFGAEVNKHEVRLARQEEWRKYHEREHELESRREAS